VNQTVKVFLIYFVSFIFIFTIFRFLIGYILPNMEGIYLVIIAAVFTVVFSPRLGKVQTGSGMRYQLKWIFKKEPIIK